MLLDMMFHQILGRYFWWSKSYAGTCCQCAPLTFGSLNWRPLL